METYKHIKTYTYGNNISSFKLTIAIVLGY